MRCIQNLNDEVLNEMDIHLFVKVINFCLLSPFVDCAMLLSCLIPPELIILVQ